ncbi:DUF4167 domain-containing protein [Acuticoccus sp. I52.16.1]|uniref:DUF4167 domain-containing protein n=1 Tax=Acuticoccus sp. I52.16.1 TaxID=2928472 RepID=UPI001FD5A5FA|nr:DUF4167 domain-containing protein [Acuticoccus sp. I52.16.1]UOM35850.1 DUF4167 domain-containing protein [Acuticoccus sp. I52.16.1]
MRPNNPSKRLRGRSRSKGGGNPLSRSYESNGPDVKIRGSALQVADKYAQLARDAQSAGDRVMAENYFQHAEHYYRIVAAAYEQSGQQQPRGERHGDDRHGDNRHRGNEQPNINGFDGMDDDDDDGSIRVNGSRSHGRDDEQDEAPVRANHRNGGSNGANGSHAAARDDDDDAADPAQAPQPDVTPTPAELDASADVKAEDDASDADGDEGDAKAKKAAKPKTPRRRTTTPRTRAPRTRRTEASADAAPQPAAETGESN